MFQGPPKMGPPFPIHIPLPQLWYRKRTWERGSLKCCSVHCHLKKLAAFLAVDANIVEVNLSYLAIPNILQVALWLLRGRSDSPSKLQNMTGTMPGSTHNNSHQVPWKSILANHPNSASGLEGNFMLTHTAGASHFFWVGTSTGYNMAHNYSFCKDFFHVEPVHHWPSPVSIQPSGRKFNANKDHLTIPSIWIPSAQPQPKHPAFAH